MCSLYELFNILQCSIQPATKVYPKQQEIRSRHQNCVFKVPFNTRPNSYPQEYKVRAKWSRYRPGLAQSVGRGIALLFHDRGTRRGWAVSSTPRTHFTPGKDPVSILQEDGWAPGPVWTDGKSRPHRDSIPDHPARRQSLYRLCYPVHILTHRGEDLQNVLAKSECPAKIPIIIWHVAHKANLYLFIIFWQMSRRLTWRKGRILSATPYQLTRLCANERDRTVWTWMKNDEKCMTKWFGPNLNAHCHERFDRW